MNEITWHESAMWFFIAQKLFFANQYVRKFPKINFFKFPFFFKFKIFMKGHGRIRGIFDPLLKNLHFGICVRDDLKTKRNGRKNCSDFYFGCLATKINITPNLH